MGVILWEDSIQQELRCHHKYQGVTALPLRAPRKPLVNTREEEKAHISLATRRSRYFAHTRTGKRYAARPVVRIKSDPWGLRTDKNDWETFRD